MDNLSSHKRKAVRQAIRAVGAKLIFLPKYSPDLNPIEQVFAKFKHLLRKAAARTIETLTAAVAEPPRSLHCQRVRQLLRQFWIRANLKSSRSNPGGQSGEPERVGRAEDDGFEVGHGMALHPEDGDASARDTICRRAAAKTYTCPP